MKIKWLQETDFYKQRSDIFSHEYDLLILWLEYNSGRQFNFMLTIQFYYFILTSMSCEANLESRVWLRLELYDTRSFIINLWCLSAMSQAFSQNNGSLYKPCLTTVLTSLVISLRSQSPRDCCYFLMSSHSWCSWLTFCHYFTGLTSHLNSFHCYHCQFAGWG